MDEEKKSNTVAGKHEDFNDIHFLTKFAELVRTNDPHGTGLCVLAEVIKVKVWGEGRERGVY